MAVRVMMRSDRPAAKITDADTGDPIKGVTKVVMTHEIGSLPEAEIHILSDDRAAYDVEADAKFFVKSTVTGDMKRVKQIEFADGEIINYEGVTS